MASLSFIIGIIGNVISILMFTSPLNTFKQVVKNKSTEDYKGLPYITTLLSTSLWTFYGLLKTGGLLVVTVNGAGAALHVVYVIIFLIYAPHNIKIKSVKLVAAVNVAFLGIVIIITLLALKGETRITLVGLLCAGLTIGMYAAPLSAMRTVIKTRSVKYMPFLLSFFQFLNGGVWSTYALLVKDYYIGVPNGIGFVLGSLQLILYMMYKNKSRPVESDDERKEKEGSAHLVKDGLQLQDLDEKTKNGSSLHKANSLPNNSIITQNVMKTPSLGPLELDKFTQRDIETGSGSNIGL
ncbi:bidirectional sugar transporter SWEET16-like [Salvia splendens]|uniref:bidirectional sugar transporter SWEET16-like n=1 Tax=Salvia splendens TaxID=180675 RepID=UPI0011046CB6|nr:bidirectional sugar transporter SWEET16-like [Salvia splendens]